MTDANRLAIAIQKGGSGKTTTAMNLASEFADGGADVLAVDMDVQGSLTDGLGLGDHYGHDVHIGSFLTGDGPPDKSPTDLIIERDPLHVIPASRNMFGLSDDLGKDRAWFKRLDSVLNTIEQQRAYDWIILDSPPQFGRVSDSCLIAGRNILIPVRVSEPSVVGLERMVKEQINPIRDDLGVPLNIACILPNCTLDSGERERVMNGLQSAFPDRTAPFEIRKRVDISRAWREGQTLFEFAPDCDMVPVYRRLAQFVSERVKQDSQQITEVTNE